MKLLPISGSLKFELTLLNPVLASSFLVRLLVVNLSWGFRCKFSLALPRDSLAWLSSFETRMGLTYRATSANSDITIEEFTSCCFA